MLRLRHCSSKELHECLGREGRLTRAVEDVGGDRLLLRMKFENALLDRFRRDQAVDRDRVLLSDAYTRSAAWFSTAGFHHGSRIIT